MSPDTPPRGSHLEDGALMRIVDGEPAADGDLPPDPDHLEACPECRARADALALRSRRFRAVLGASDADAAPPAWDPDFLARIGVEDRPAAPAAPSAPVSRTRRGRLPVPLRWAAALALLAAVGLASPVRAWIAEGTRALWSVLTDGAADEAPLPPPPEEGGVAVAVRPPGERLRLLLPATGGPAAVRFEPAAGPDATARLVGGRDAEIVALTDGFRIVGADGATLGLRLPAGVRTVSIVRDGRPPGDVPARDTAWTLSLGPEG